MEGIKEAPKKEEEQPIEEQKPTEEQSPVEEQEPEDKINPQAFPKAKRILYYSLKSFEKEDELDKLFSTLENKRGIKEYFQIIYEQEFEKLLEEAKDNNKAQKAIYKKILDLMKKLKESESRKQLIEVAKTK